VPSNYITRLVGEDLMEFHQSVVVGGGSGPNTEIAEEGWSTSIPQVRVNIHTTGQGQHPYHRSGLTSIPQVRVNFHTTGQGQHPYHRSGLTSIPQVRVNIHTTGQG
jgi:hypothetical protein